MPIKPENKVLYPHNWKQISEAVRKDQGNTCARCLKPHLRIVAVAANGWWHDRWKGVWRGPDHQVSTDAPPSTGPDETYRTVKVVLTCAHIHDPNPANCVRSNLQALCQYCHNALDGPMRRRNAAETRRRKRLAVQPELELV